MTRRLPKHNFGSGYSLGVLTQIFDHNARVLWEVGKSIAIKPKRHLCAVGRVMCTELKIEHVQDITEEDARREGVEPIEIWEHRPVECFDRRFMSYREGFKEVWRKLYPSGPKSWGANPLAVVIEFRPLREGEH